MCGIAGCLAENIQNVSEAAVVGMRDSILYRGRDDQGQWGDGQHVYLLHSRLSIIDIATGQQPMRDVSGRYTIVYNGEIYNYRELRRIYEQQGALFNTQSDTEVILEGFKLKGPDVCTDLNGMFAFAIWDTQAKRLFLARDRLGKKPLYWCFLNGIFYFASTLDAFRMLPGWDGQLSPSAIVVYALLGGFPEQTTIYQQAQAVPPASYGFVKPGQTDLTCTRYWRMGLFTKSKAALTELLEEYEAILTDATAIRLRSEVPLALTFSAGVDSGTIAAICAKKLNTSLTCYTIDYHTPHDPSEETINAKQTAAHLGLPWHYIHFDYHHDLLNGLPDAYYYYDQPSSQLPLVYSDQLYKTIKPYATVVLSGNGADELFTGYIGDEKARQQDIFLSLLRPARPVLSALVKNNTLNQRLRQHLFLRKLFYAALPAPQAFVNALLKRVEQIDHRPAVLEAVQAVLQTIADEAMLSGAASILDFKMFLGLNCSTIDANYRLPDISGLAAQVEVRSPYLDYRMVEFAARLPHHFKVGKPFSATHNKYLSKLYYQQFVPVEIAWSQKKGMGWNLRWDKSISNDPDFEQIFSQAYQSLHQSGLNAGAFHSAWEQYRAGDNAAVGTMMTGFMLGAWLQRNIIKSPNTVDAVNMLKE